MQNVLLATRARWLKAYLEGDTATLDAVEGAQFTVTNAWGSQSKQEQLAGIARAVHAQDWFPHGTRIDDIDRHVRIQGDVALIRGVGRTVMASGTLPAMAFTEVWQRVGDAWQAIHLHYSEVRRRTEDR